LDSIHIYMVMLPNKFAFVVLAMDWNLYYIFCLSRSNMSW
jgi:hypothetical protein